jgi:HEAT repeat-containing protein 5
VEAIASLIDQDSSFVFDALDGKTDLPETNGQKPGGIPYRNEPVAFFFVLFGLAFEALVTRSNDSGPSRSQNLEILTALKKILRPSVSGLAIYQEVVFSETMDMFDRLVLTESLNVQLVVVEIARNLCLEHPSARKSSRCVSSRSRHILTGTASQVKKSGSPKTSTNSSNSPGSSFSSSPGSYPVLPTTSREVGFLRMRA